MKALTSIALVFVSFSAAAAIRLDAPRVFRTKPQPLRMAVADFDGDGHPDLVVGSSATGLTVIRGSGDGTFAEEGSEDVAQMTVSAALFAADFSGDGKPDLAVATPGALRFARGRGDSTFDLPIFSQLAPSSAQAVSGAAADFDGDGRLDIAVAADTFLFLERNIGDGHFTQTTTSIGISTAAMESADLNTDGKPDLVVASRDGSVVAVLLNTGSGFAAPVTLATSAVPAGISIADFNRDGRADLFVTTLSTTAHLFAGRGNGTFDPPSNIALPATAVRSAYWTQSSATADFNHDGAPDVVIRVKLYGRAWAVYLQGNGDGTFRTAGQIVALGPLVAADLDHDGNADVVIGNDELSSSVRSISIVQTRPDGKFVVPSVIYPAAATEVSPGSHVITAADFDSDGRVDIAEVAGGGVSILRANGNGTFTTKTTSITASGTEAEAADFDGDGSADLAILTGSTITIAFNRGNFVFEPATVTSIAEATELAAGDADGDGRTDLVVVGFNNKQVALLRNLGGGAFAMPAAIALTTECCNYFPSSAIVRDFDGDGRADILIGLAGGGFGAFELHKQSPAGGIGVPVLYGSYGGTVLAADFNRDGILDVVSAGFGPLNIALGIQGGTFTPQAAIDSIGNSSKFGLAAADFDADGFLDLIASDFVRSSLSVYPGKGDGTFAAPLRFAPFGLPIIAADFTGDAKPDVVAGVGAVTILIVNHQSSDAPSGGGRRRAVRR